VRPVIPLSILHTFHIYLQLTEGGVTDTQCGHALPHGGWHYNFGVATSTLQRVPWPPPLLVLHATIAMAAATADAACGDCHTFAGVDDVLTATESARQARQICHSRCVRCCDRRYSARSAGGFSTLAPAWMGLPWHFQREMTPLLRLTRSPLR
jgi:hypothetical protein